MVLTELPYLVDVLLPVTSAIEKSMTTLTLDTNTLFALLDNNPESVVYFIPVCKDPAQTVIDFEVAYCNKKAAATSFITVDELAGQRVLSMVNTDEAVRELMFQQLLDVYSKGSTLENTYYNPALKKHFSIIRSKVEEGVLTIARDISDEMLIKTEQQRQSELINSILDSTLDCVMAMDAIRDESGEIIDFRFTKINKVLANKLNMQEEDLIGKTYLSISPNSNKYGLFDLKKEAIETKKPVKTEVYFEGLGIDGWYTISIVPLGNNGIVETFSDITESKKDKEKLEDVAQRLETIVNTSKAGMFTIKPIRDESGEVIDFIFDIVNQAVASYIGQTAEVLKGSLASIYFPAYKTNGLFDIYKNTLLYALPHNFDFHYEDGYDVFFNIDVVKMGEEVLVTFTDHTHLKRLQRELELKVLELGRSNANLEEFAHAASHDMKEPLRKIRIFADRLKQSLGVRMNENEMSLFERIEVSTERMQLLVDDLLEFSHVSKNPHQKEFINLNEKIEKVLTDLELPIEEKKARISFDSLPTIHGYRRQLQQLFLNLIGNALKYSKSDVAPEIIIKSSQIKGSNTPIEIPEARLSTDFHLIEVHDNGIGFEQQYADRIFDMFQRLHGKAEYTGTGIGLSIARKVVENHDGYIWATSELNKGATFSILLPVTD